MAKYYGNNNNNWMFSEPLQARFVAATCLLQCLQGKQQEPAIASDESPSVDHEPLSEAPSDDSGTIAVPKYAGLRKRFLNRLAEILAREKHAAFVTATAMAEYEHTSLEDREDHVTFYYARNAPSEKQDATFLAALKRSLKAVSRQGKT